MQSDQIIFVLNSSWIDGAPRDIFFYIFLYFSIYFFYIFFCYFFSYFFKICYYNIRECILINIRIPLKKFQYTRVLLYFKYEFSSIIVL